MGQVGDQIDAIRRERWRPKLLLSRAHHLAHEGSAFGTPALLAPVRVTGDHNLPAGAARDPRDQPQSVWRRAGVTEEPHRVPATSVAKNGIDAIDAGHTPPESMPVLANRTKSRARRTHRTASLQLPSMLMTS